MELGPSSTFIPFTRVPIPWQIMILYSCTKIEVEYSYIAHLYYAVKPSVLSHIILRLSKISCIFSNSSKKRLLREAVVAASYFLSSDKNEWNIAWCENFPDTNNGIFYCGELMCSKEMALIYTYLLPQ